MIFVSLIFSHSLTNILATCLDKTLPESPLDPKTLYLFSPI